MAISNDREILSTIFGTVGDCDSAEQCAKLSKKQFVRSQDHLAFDNERATGLRLSAWQALKTYGLPTLLEVLDFGSAILTTAANEPADTIKRQREELGLSHHDVAAAARLDEREVIDAENPHTRTDVHALVKIAQVLALEELELGYEKGASADAALALRLKEMGTHVAYFRPKLVVGFAEAAWVIRKQAELQEWLAPIHGYRTEYKNFTASDNYGSPSYPTWLHGYYLAQETRKKLGLANNPIPCLRDLIEDVLGIPLVQMALPRRIGGATVAVGETRGLVANATGYNENVWTRRATLAHELGHLLWDPEERLKRIVVDEDDSIEKLFALQYLDSKPRGFDVVEARANAFSIAFLAPQEATLEVFESTLGPMSFRLRKVMETFGISYMAAKYHLWNILERKVPLNEFVVDDVEPTDDWTARESYTLDFFKPETVRLSRRGLFSREVLRAHEGNFITTQTAASYLDCTVQEFLDNKELIESFFINEA